MEKTAASQPAAASHGADHGSNYEIHAELLLNLPREKSWDGDFFRQYQGFWYRSPVISGMISAQRHFQALDSDIILASFPKSGTTWLKALAFTIVNRSRYALENSPLLTTPPHDLVPFLELDLYLKNPSPNLGHLPTPRILATHAPYTSLPSSIVRSNCRIVYICRNPLDQFISHWQFAVEHFGRTVQLSLEEAFEKVCDGVQGFGPIWEHVLGYWKASKEDPHKILFLKYEDLKEDINFYVKKLADFLGYPFTEDEERQEIIEEISKLCSFNHLKNLEVNKNGKHVVGIKNNTFFRKGIVGDWKNYLTPSMSEQLGKILEEKFSGSGLIFKTS